MQFLENRKECHEFKRISKIDLFQTLTIKMTFCFGDHMNAKIRKVYQRLADHSPDEVKDMYQKGIMLKNGDGGEKKSERSFSIF